VKPDNFSWLRLLVFSWLTVLALSLVLAVVLVGVTMAVGDGEPPRMPERKSGDLIVPGPTSSGVIADAQCGPQSK
jgi:hypothetical protein